VFVTTTICGNDDVINHYQTRTMPPTHSPGLQSTPWWVAQAGQLGVIPASSNSAQSQLYSYRDGGGVSAWSFVTNTSIDYSNDFTPSRRRRDISQ